MVQKFNEDRDWDQFHTPKELAISIATEAGELLQIFRFKTDQESRDIFNTKKGQDVKDELMDVLYFVLRFAQLYKIDMTEAMTQKLEKSAKKYPIEKFKGSNKKYDEID